MDEKPHINPENTIISSIKNELDKITIELNKTETTQENESLSLYQINEINQFNNIEENPQKNIKQITDNLQQKNQKTKNFSMKKENDIKEFSINENKFGKNKSSLKGSNTKINYIKKTV